ncbi:MAG: choice-of-anchor Q domain-containing protein, partial [Myxococcota bacterium]
NGTPTELRFGPDRAGFGTDLYVGLSVAASGATGVESGIYRFDATGTRTTFSLASADPDFTGAPSGLAFSGIGAFGGDLYACVNTDAIVRIDDAGDVDRFVESIGTCSSLAFSDDGQTMFFIESGTGTLWALRQVPPPNVSIGDFVVYEENFRGESGSSTSPEFDELGLSGFTGSTLPSGSGPDLTGRVAVYQIDGPSGEVAGRLTADASPLSDGSFSIRSQMSGLEAPPLLGSVAASQGASYADGPDTVAVNAEVSFTWDAMGLPQASLSVVEQRLPSGPIFTSEDALPAPMVTAMLAGDPFELTLEVDRSGASGLASAIVELDAGLSVSTGPLVFSIVTTGAFEDLRHAFGLDGIDFEPVRLTLERFEVTQPYAQSFSVDTTLDGVDFLPGDGFCSTSAAECSLRAAIQEANALPGATEIVLRPGTHTLTIPGDDEDAAATGDLDVLDDVGIRGDGPDVTIVDGNALDRVFHNGPLFFSTPTLRLEGVAVTGGQADDANNPTGGGIFSNGPLFLADCSISGNRANLGGGIRGGNRFSMQRCVVEANEAVAYFTFADGGGLDVERSGSIPIRAQVFDSAIVSNLAESGAGLGCSGFGSFGSSDRIWVENTTMSGNVNSVSGAQLSFANCSATVVQSTVVGDVGSGLRALRGALSSATLEIENSVISGTPACEPFSTLSPTLDGHNASADTSCGFNGPGDLEGVSLDLAPLAPLDTIEGLLASTRAHVPNPGSPLIEAADEARCTGFDQRRLPRPVDGDADGTALCDLGAIEVPEPRSWLGLGVGALGLAFLRRRSLVGAEATR